MNPIPLFTALTLTLGELPQPILTQYTIGLTVYRLFIKHKYKNQPIAKDETQENLPNFQEIIDSLIRHGILVDKKISSPKSVFAFVGKTKLDPLETVCTLDPFAYLSHFSAMEFYGLTDRFPKTIYVSSPRPSQWKKYAKDQMYKDLKEDYTNYIKAKYPLLKNLRPQKIEKRNIKIFNTSHLGAYKNIKDRNIRVSTIGRTFLNMLQNPDLCGGINHVIDCFEDHAQIYINNIVNEVERNGSKIDKIRAGYILDEICELKHEMLDNWLQLTQRGGSMKLDSSGEYDPNYSEKWQLSINVYRE